MKKLLILSVCLLGLIACGPSKKLDNSKSTPNSCEVADDTPKGVALNDIRFAGWTSKEWADNEYIRTLRKYLDAYNSGKIEDASLDEYKDYIKGKFVIADIEPYIVGGAYISIIFYNNPDKIFSAVVYSDVNIKTRKVSNYEFRSMDLTLTGYDVTQEEIHQFLDECPEHKLW